MIKNIFLISVFALFMSVTFAAKSVFNMSLAVSTYAGGNGERVAFRCPEGVSACYRADGSEYVDVNNLTATAAGVENTNNSSNPTAATASPSAAKYAKPRHYRSF